MRKNSLHLLTTILLLLDGVCPAFSEQPKLNALILSGANNHNWKATTPQIVSVLEESGRFEVKVADDVAALTPSAFAGLDVVVCNFNTYGKKNVGEVWNREMRDAFVKFIKSGKGIVSVHAGNSVWADWPEIQKLVCGTWVVGKTNHGKMHANEIVLTDSSHPITRGLPVSFWAFDEFWQNLVVAPGAVTLATVTPRTDKNGSGKPEPMLLVNTLEGGRGVGLLLGHDAKAMGNPGFRALLARSAEWAATGTVTLPPPASLPKSEADVATSAPAVAAPAAPSSGAVADLLAAIKPYQLGGDATALNSLSRKVESSVSDSSESAGIAAQLAAASADASYSLYARENLLRLLRLVGTPAQVPGLVKLLAEPSLGFWAAGALECIPGKEAGAALIDAIGTAPANLRGQLVGALGRRHEVAGIPVLEKVLAGSEPGLAKAAANALALMNDPAVVPALEKASKSAQPAVAAAAAKALLDLAAAQLSKGNKDPIAWLEKLAASSPDSAVGRDAAALLFCSAGSPEKLVAALRSKNAAEAASAVAALRNGVPDSWIPAVASALKEMDPATGSQVLAFFADRGITASGAAVLEVAKSSSPARADAIQALAAVGDAAAIDFLLSEAEKGTDRAAAMDALEDFKSSGADAALISRLDKATPQQLRVLVDALGARGATAAIPALMALTSSPDGKARAASFRALGKLVGPPEMNALADKVKAGGADSTSWATLLASAAGRSKGDEVVNLLPEVIRSTNPQNAAILIVALGETQNNAALPVLNEKLNAQDQETKRAAVRALGRLHTKDGLRRLAVVCIESPDAILKKLALQTLCDTISPPNIVEANLKIELLGTASNAAIDTPDRQAFLAALSAVRDPRAFPIVLSISEADPTISKEVEAAIEKIEKATGATAPRKPAPAQK